MRPLTLQLLPELSHERFTSGAQLAAKFGVSRSAVSEALREAGEAGVEIFSLTRRGYRLAEPLEMLDVDRIRPALGAAARRVDVEVMPSVDSTNSVLMARALDGAPSGACLVAEQQTAGRGRRGRSWQSAFGASLTLSLLWRFDRGAAQLGGLSLAVGLAVLRALTACGASGVRLKWPNDIVVDGRKLGGILIESQGDMLGPTSAVIGIGLNVRLSPAVAAAMAASIAQPVADVQSVCSTPVSRNILAAAVLRELVAVLDVFQKSGFSPMRAEWLAAHALQGSAVRVLNADGSGFDAIVRGVGDDGSLSVTRNGRDLALSFGELSVRRAPGAKP